MTDLTVEEVRPGLVVLLDPAVAIREPGCSTNALEGREVRGRHPFLILMVFEDHALAAPLFSTPAPDRRMLKRHYKSGVDGDSWWMDRRSYFHYWQQWWIPVNRMPEATVEHRGRGYALRRPDELAELAGWRHRNRQGWRGL